MLKKTIHFKNLDGLPVHLDFYFNISKSELLDMQNSTDVEAMEDRVRRLTSTQNGLEAYKVFKEIVLTAVGKRSLDGLRFIKSQEIRDEFEQMDAFSELIFEFLEDAGKAAEFMQGVMPDLDEVNRRVEAGAANASRPQPQDYKPKQNVQTEQQPPQAQPTYSMQQPSPGQPIYPAQQPPAPGYPESSTAWGETQKG